MASQAALEMPIIIKRKQINENEAEKTILCILVHAHAHICVNSKVIKTYSSQAHFKTYTLHI